MLKFVTRKISPIVLTVAIMFVTVFSMNMFVQAASFTPRLSAPSYQNDYYYSNKNVFYKYGYGMPNCTAYAYGRAYEILKTEPKLSWNGAGGWFSYNKQNGYYKYGNTPKLGAIACWSYSGGGHVAVVEKIENGKITLSNSEWGGRTFYLTEPSVNDKNYGGNSYWNFEGFIYIGDFSTQPTTEKKYEIGTYKTSVDDYLNMRSGAGTSYSTVTSIPDGVLLDVTQIKTGDGYTWGYTIYKTYKGWVALDFCVFVSKPATTEPTTKPTEEPTTKPTTKPSEEPTTKPTEKPSEQPSTEPSEKPTGGLGVGDVNCDNVINILDVTEIQKHLAKLNSLTEEQIKYCDFNFDGEVTILDVTCIQKYIANIY